MQVGFFPLPPSTRRKRGREKRTVHTDSLPRTLWDDIIALSERHFARDDPTGRLEHIHREQHIELSIIIITDINTLSLEEARERPRMIHMQVHLQVPCYDFCLF